MNPAEKSTFVVLFVFALWDVWGGGNMECWLLLGMATTRVQVTSQMAFPGFFALEFAVKINPRYTETPSLFGLGSLHTDGATRVPFIPIMFIP